MTDDENPENATEFVLQKEGAYVQMWVVIDGQQVFHAAPHWRAVKGPVQAAIQTFLSRAFEAEMMDDVTPDDDSSGLF